MSETSPKFVYLNIHSFGRVSVVSDSLSSAKSCWIKTWKKVGKPRFVEGANGHTFVYHPDLNNTHQIGAIQKKEILSGSVSFHDR